MKVSFSVLMLLLFVMFSAQCLAQSKEMKTKVRTIKAQYESKGFHLLSEAGQRIKIGKVFKTKPYTYKMKKRYALVAVVDYCLSCPLVLEFYKPGHEYFGSKDAKLKVNIKRLYPGEDMSILSWMGLNKDTEEHGIFVLSNPSYTNCHAQVLVFEEN